ncbi:helix-turn-helix transcriptional regulator [Mucilaginibacter sp. UR6-11]|uniref:helix-turn-helix domain-containing protein n=1 Tax=Mucilaginibacter sp. UR6-11 TaxID=1435644 RepID=UPI001E4149B7|nr:helix-turn-helix transcriptional regulator [Mucilaginibacter sp. UR6-11]MCC8424367.1 helix-turn-helix transcriptional regulator [Mucilaginibacter sp. UR6-11]
MTREQTAMLVREGRLKKALTQKELSELAGISLRSLQRVENAEVLPRFYTWRRLAEHIDLGLNREPQSSLVSKSMPAIPIKTNLPRKWILSISSLAVIVLSFSAYVIQSPTFPETLFETLNMVLVGCVIYAAIIYRVWK